MVEIVLSKLGDLLQSNDSLSYPGNCRNAALNIASYLSREFPQVSISFLAYPDAIPNPEVHYCLLINVSGEEIIVNPVHAALFPVYLGRKENAPYSFGWLKVVQKVL